MDMCLHVYNCMVLEFRLVQWDWYHLQLAYYADMSLALYLTTKHKHSDGWSKLSGIWFVSGIW